MKNYNIVKDLIIQLRKIDPENLFYEFLSMVNGNYFFKKDYLNNIPHNVLVINLKKIMDIIKNHPYYIENINKLDTIELVYDVLHSLKAKDLKLDKQQEKEFEKKIRKVKTDNFFKKAKKPMIYGVSASILIAFIFFSCGKNQNQNKEIKEEIKTEKDIDETFGRENTLAVEEKYKDKSDEFNNLMKDIVKDGYTVNNENEEMTKDEKVEYILNEYNLTPKQFEVLCAIVMSEAWVNSYEDAYAVINTIYNRTISKNWVSWIDKNVGENTGVNLYYQATFPDQFVVYQDGVYVKNLGVKEGRAYDAIIDFLMTKEVKHDFLEFRANYCNVKGEKFDNNGNIYFNLLEEEDRITNSISR